LRKSLKREKTERLVKEMYVEGKRKIEKNGLINVIKSDMKRAGVSV